MSSADIKLQYDTILAKLRSTLDLYRAGFPELSAVDAYLRDFPQEAGTEGECLQRLGELCDFLGGLGTGSYVIRHLYASLCADVEAVGSRIFRLDGNQLYITLPS